MRKISILLLLALSLLSVSCNKKETETTAPAETKTETHRIVSLNGAVSEIISALGHEKDIVGRDVTSTYPETLKATATDLGHVRSISAEAILKLKPTLVLATDKDMNPELLEKLKAAGIKTEVYAQEFSIEGTDKLIAQVANTIGNENYFQLQEKISSDRKDAKTLNPQPKVLFIYARGANMLMVSGTGTPVDKMISLAGGKNAVSDFEDYKPLTPEALIKGNPDVILMFDSGLQSVGGAEGVLKIPGVDKTNAGKNKKIISMDGALLSGFGPRLGEGIYQLNSLLAENAK
jgi:iron complex transport system substrate-binding protein